MPGPINTIVLTLLEASITLYPADRAGQPVLSQPLWHGVAAADLTVRDRWIKVETRATGAKYPRKHNLSPQFEITIGRVWALPLSQLEGFNPQRGAYVMDVVWRDEETRDWHREIFYGVTISERTRDARDRDGEFVDNQVFDAEYLAPPTSGRGSPPVIPTALPLTVRYISDSEDVLLYSYDPGSASFNEATAGITTGRASLSYLPGDRSGTFDAVFSGAGFPAMRLTADGVIEAFDFIASTADTAQLPRMDFYLGTTRIGSVTSRGRIYASAFMNQIPAAGDGRVQLYNGATLAAAWSGSGLVCQSFHTFTPADLSGCKLWTRVESIGLGDGSPLGQWNDESGNSNHLLQTVHDGGGGTTIEPPVYLEHAGNGAYQDLPVPPDSPGFNRLPDQLPIPSPDLPAVSFLMHEPPAPGPGTRRQFLATAGDVLNTDTHCIFVVAVPFQIQAASASVNNTLGLVNTAIGGTTGDIYFNFRGDAVEPFYARHPVANYIPDGTSNAAISSDLIYPLGELHWRLLEQEVTDTQIIVRQNGSAAATSTLSGVKPGNSKPIELGIGLFGLVRSLIVIEGNPTSEEKAKVRQFLNNAYAIY